MFLTLEEADPRPAELAQARGGVDRGQHLQEEGTEFKGYPQGFHTERVVQDMQCASGRLVDPRYDLVQLQPAESCNYKNC